MHLILQFYEFFRVFHSLCKFVLMTNQVQSKIKTKNQSKKRSSESFHLHTCLADLSARLVNLVYVV